MLETLLIAVAIGTTTPTQELLETKIETTTSQPAEAPPPEPTLEEKIKANVNNCNEQVQWIRADNAECLDKPTTTTSWAYEPRTAVLSPSTGINGYYAGQCTAWVAQQRYVPSGWGDASNWGYAARRAGWTVSPTPVAGAIAWRYGHVAYVLSVGAGTVTISEQNYDYRSSIRTITVPTSSYQYIY